MILHSLRLGLASPASPFCVGPGVDLSLFVLSPAPDPAAAPAESSFPAACADCSCPRGPQNDEIAAFCERVDNVDFPAASASGSHVTAGHGERFSASCTWTLLAQ